MIVLPMLFIVCSALSISMVAWAVVAEVVPRRERRLQQAIGDVLPAAPHLVEAEAWDMPDRASTITALMARMPWTERLQMYLLRAGWTLRPSEFVAYATLGGMALAAMLVLMFHTAWLVPVGLAAGWVVALLLLVNAQHKRNQQLSAQLPDALDMLASAVRAGFSLSQGMSRARAQMAAPISVEFGRCLEDVQLGRSLSEALEATVARTGNYDLALVASAMQTQLETGGNMAEILSKISAMIRERVRLQGEINVASAEGRFAAIILVILPIGMLLFLRLTSPLYLEPLFATRVGNLILASGGALMVVGGIILRRLVMIRV